MNLNGTLAELGGKLGKSLPTAIGDTPDGRAWCLKACNPSDQTVDCRGIPDDFAGQVIHMNYSQSFGIEPAYVTSQTQTIDLQMRLHAHPIAPADVAITARGTANPSGLPPFFANDYSQSFTYLNNEMGDQLLPPTTIQPWANKVAAVTANYLAKCAFWKSQCLQSRISYMGWTLLQTAGSQTDEGILICGQQCQRPQCATVVNPQTGGSQFWSYYPSYEFTTYDNAVTNIRTHSGYSKNGCYQALKLDKKFADFKNNNTSVVTTSDALSTAAVDAYNVVTPALPAVPYAQPMIIPQVFFQIQNGTPGIGVMDDYVAQVHIRGIAPGTTYLTWVYWGVESIPIAGTVFSPFRQMSPISDPLAIRMYGEINNKISQDGYDAEWNQFDFLADIISELAPTLAEKFIPGSGKYADMAVGLVNKLRGKKGGKRSRSRAEFKGE